MKKTFRYSDLVTTSRIILVGLFALVISFQPKTFGLIPGLILVLFIFLTDSLDGLIARKFNEKSEFGPFYDIVGDRVAEVAILIPFIYLRITTPIPLLYLLTRGYLVDYRRMYQYVLSKKAPFKQLKTKWASFLISSPFMRQIYLFSKILMAEVFYALIFLDDPTLRTVGDVIPFVVIAISLARTIPVYLDN